MKSLYLYWFGTSIFLIGVALVSGFIGRVFQLTLFQSCLIGLGIYLSVLGTILTAIGLYKTTE